MISTTKKIYLLLFMVVVLGSGCSRAIKPDDMVMGQYTKDTLLVVTKGFLVSGLLVDGYMNSGVFRPFKVFTGESEDKEIKILYEAKGILWFKGLFGTSKYNGGFLVKEKNGSFEVVSCYHRRMAFNGMHAYEDFTHHKLPEDFEFTLISLNDTSGKLEIIMDTRKDQSRPPPLSGFARGSSP